MSAPSTDRLAWSSLTFVSGNESKRREYADLLGIPDLRSVDPSFEEPQSLDLGALVEAKIRRVQNLVTPPFFVEHTGLLISGWNDFPGGLSSDLVQCVGAVGLCRMLRSYSDAERAARAQVAIGYYHPEHRIRIFRGEVAGHIAPEPAGDKGFGWDSIFVPEGGDGRTYGQMSLAEKNRTSMRRSATEAFQQFLKQYFEDAPVLKVEDEAAAKSRGEVFVSYSHADDDWFEKLRTALAPVIRNQSIKLWSDRDISPGQTWKPQIKAALARAKVAVLLVSPKFLASDFIMDEELPFLLEAAPKGTAILWVLVSQCLYNETPIGAIQAAHRPLRPLDALPDSALNETLAQITENIAAAARS